MAVTESKLIRDFVGAIKDGTKEKTKAYETPATVTRIEDGIAWVHVPGGVEETPVQLTINATEGDTVRVRVANGRATIVGNVTSPPTDDAMAKEALSNANSAIQSARNASMAAASAEASAKTAKEAAEDALETAGSVHDIAVEAQKDATAAKSAAASASDEASAAASAASQAQTDAEDAKNAADYATYSLSLLEDIVGTLNWISQHGVYVVSTDTTVVPNKTYYTLAGTVITSPTGNPSANAYYELAGNVYVLSSDTIVDTSKTYYQVTATAVIDPTGDPSTNPYYELQIDEAITQYINTHLTLTERGLSVTDGSSSSLLISSDGVKIYSNGHMVGQYGEGAIIGDENGYHIEITGDKLSFVNGKGTAATEIAYMQYNELYIPRVVVVDSMQIGHWIWDAISEDSHLTLKWRG